MPNKKSKQPKSKKSAKKASRRAHSPSPTESDNGQSQAASASSASQSRTSSRSRSRNSSRARTPTHQDVVNDDFEADNLSESDSVGSQVASHHPQSPEVIHPLEQEVLSDPPREVNTPSGRSESDSDVQCLGHIAAKDGNQSGQAESLAGGKAGNFPEISRSTPAADESVAISQRVSGPEPVNAENSTLSLSRRSKTRQPIYLVAGARQTTNKKTKAKK
jgi:hypothetical protein